MVVFRRRASPYLLGNRHSLAPSGRLISAVPGQAHKSSYADQRQQVGTKKQDGPRTVHAKDQMSLAGVGGSLTDCVTTSNMSSGEQTGVKVQKGRDCFPKTMAKFSYHTSSELSHNYSTDHFQDPESLLADAFHEG